MELIVRAFAYVIGSKRASVVCCSRTDYMSMLLYRTILVLAFAPWFCEKASTVLLVVVRNFQDSNFGKSPPAPSNGSVRIRAPSNQVTHIHNVTKHQLCTT